VKKGTPSKTILFITSACLSAPLWATPVWAQQAPAVRTAQVEEVIVTARKREESILNVPEVETVIPQARLQSLQTVAITDLPTIAPGLQLGHDVLGIGTQVSIRGIGTSSSDQGVDQSISLNIDGLSLGNGLAFQSGLFDLQRVEVLKGPQNLFFGESSPGGVISFHTADPTDEFEVIGRAAYDFEAMTPRGEAIISGPVTDTLEVRLAGMYSTSQGYFYNLAEAVPGTGAVDPTSRRSPDSLNYMIRGTVLWAPMSELSVRLKLNHVYDRTINAENAEVTSCPQGPNFAPSGIPFLGGDLCKSGRGLRVVFYDPAAFPEIVNTGIPYVRTQQDYGTLELNYTPLPDVTFTSVTAYYHMLNGSLLNTSESSAAGPALAAENIYHRNQVSEEVRANSNFSGPVNFTAGGYYESGSVRTNVILIGNTAYGVPPYLGNSLIPMDITIYSLFGQLRYDILPNLELAGGLRWTDETRTESPLTILPPTLGPSGPTIPVPLKVTRISAQPIAPEVTLTYRPTDDVTFFASYKQAYKSGSFTLATPPAPGGNNAFGEERVIGEEVGVKSRLLDNTLALNVAGYYNDYSGLQVGAVQPVVAGHPGAGIVITTVNAGLARTYGIDLDATYYPPAVTGLTLRGEVNWDQATYVTLNNVPCWGGQTIALGCNLVYNPGANFGLGGFTAQSLSGTPMVRAPRWQLNFGFDYEIPVMDNYSLVLSNNNAFSSKYVADLAVNRPNNDNYQTAFWKTDLSLTLKSPNDNWELAVIGKNLNDAVTTGNCSSANLANGVIFDEQITGKTFEGPAGVDQMVCFMDPGREIWIRLTIKPLALIQ
jgi:iron complex outermembrane receptor protein